MQATQGKEKEETFCGHKRFCMLQFSWVPDVGVESWAGQQPLSPPPFWSPLLGQHVPYFVHKSLLYAQDLTSSWCKFDSCVCTELRHVTQPLLVSSAPLIEWGSHNCCRGLFKKRMWDFPGRPVAKILCSQAWSVPSLVGELYHTHHS